MAAPTYVKLNSYSISIAEHQMQHFYGGRGKSIWNCDQTEFHRMLTTYVENKVKQNDLEVVTAQTTLYIYDSIKVLTPNKIAATSDFTVQITIDHSGRKLEIHAYPDEVNNAKYGWAYQKSKIKDFCNKLE